MKPKIEKTLTDKEKPKSKPAKGSKRRGSPRNNPDYKGFANREYKGADGQTRSLPPLLEAVVKLYPFKRRSEIVRTCMQLYGVKTRTVDKAIADAKAEFADYPKAKIQDLKALALSRVRHAADKALEAGEFNAYARLQEHHDRILKLTDPTVVELNFGPEYENKIRDGIRLKLDKIAPAGKAE